MRQDRVPGEVHRCLLAHQKFMNLKTAHDVSLEEAAIDIWKKGIATVSHLNTEG